MNKLFFYVESVSTWISLKHIESIYHVQNWVIRMQSGSEVQLTDNEYWKLADQIRQPVLPPMHPQVTGEHYRFDERKDEHRQAEQ